MYEFTISKDGRGFWNINKNGVEFQIGFPTEQSAEWAKDFLTRLWNKKVW